MKKSRIKRRKKRTKLTRVKKKNHKNTLLHLAIDPYMLFASVGLSENKNGTMLRVLKPTRRDRILH